MDKMRCSLYEVLLCLSNAQDFISPILSSHHQQVSYLSYRICEQLGFSNQEQKDVFLAALVHDIGALSANELLALTENEPLTVNHHAFKGALLLEGFKPLQSIAPLVRYHHIPWNHGKGQWYQGEAVSLLCHVIHLADRFCTSIQKPNQNILSQVPHILASLEQHANTLFVPEFLEAIKELSHKEYIWLDLISHDPVKHLPDSGLWDKLILDIHDTLDFAILLSRIIDFRSPFTAYHSAGVAKVAEHLAKLLGFSAMECTMMLIAGYLHDLGKLAIDNAILDKQDSLTADEFNQIRGHTYYTYTLLDQIKAFDTIKTWAAFHHERMDGRGYPFHLNRDTIPLGSRIMAVADVYSALVEDRPYRKGMTHARAMEILVRMTNDGALDGAIVSLLQAHASSIEAIRKQSQEDLSALYAQFLQL